jgi:hypothetical protein
MHCRAVATTTDPGDHAACTFVYTVRAHVYHGSASCPVTSVGDAFTVTYDPRDPPAVATDNPASTLLTGIAILLIGAGTFGVVVTLGLRNTYRWLVGGDAEG